jgi:3-methylfumaryl-CoA hydratase
MTTWSDTLSKDSASQLEASATSVRRSEACGRSLARRIAAMLDIDPDTISEGAALPQGWHFPILAGDTCRSALRADGFPGFGVPMPELDLPRLLLLGRTVEFLSDILVGSTVERVSTLDKLQHKETPAGPAAIVTLRHDLTVESDAPAIIETQTYMLLGPTRQIRPAAVPQPVPDFEFKKIVTPDETMLFQYSALGFNSHKIHLDRAYARDVEGLPDLVVNGGLITLLLTEFLRIEMKLRLSRYKTRHKAPLYCGRPVTLAANRDSSVVQLFAFDDAGSIATEMEAEVE